MAALDPVVIFTAAAPQVAIAVPAATVGAVVMVNVLVEVTAVHVPFGLAVNVNVTLPAEISAALGVYVAVVIEVELVKVPVPLEVQAKEALLVTLEPAVTFTAIVPQVATAVPATAVGGAVMVMFLVDVTFAQVPFPVAVKVKVRVPAVTSAALGV